MTTIIPTITATPMKEKRNDTIETKSFIMLPLALGSARVEDALPDFNPGRIGKPACRDLPALGSVNDLEIHYVAGLNQPGYFFRNDHRPGTLFRNQLLEFDR